MARRTFKSIGEFLLNLPSRWICKHEYNTQAFVRFNERPVELEFVFRKLMEIYPLKILDVGTGSISLPHLMRKCGFLVTAIDNIHDYWPAGRSNRHYHVINDDITNTNLKDTFDLITCISVLEHIKKPDSAVRNMFSLLNPNGYLILTFPYNENRYVQNVYELTGSSYGQNVPFITQSYSRTELNKWVQENHGTIVEQEYWQFWEGDHWTVGNQIIPPRKVGAGDNHQLTCILIQRTGE
ncbi:MAG: class I SAM-dependent methyltransferase [Sedimentisphaerales bacterium]|nr:class I SAM-dependent methyltransferase [Sedimentisphaerales bacterium]